MLILDLVNKSSDADISWSHFSSAMSEHLHNFSFLLYFLLMTTLMMMTMQSPQQPKAHSELSRFSLGPQTLQNKPWKGLGSMSFIIFDLRNFISEVNVPIVCLSQLVCRCVWWDGGLFKNKVSLENTLHTLRTNRQRRSSASLLGLGAPGWKCWSKDFFVHNFFIFGQISYFE